MPDIHDYHRFTNTQGDSHGSSERTGCLPWLLLVFIVFLIIGKLAG